MHEHNPDTLPKRVFFCLLVIIIFIGFMTSGCHSTKWEWMPNRNENQPNKHKTNEPSALNPPTPQGITILKGSF